VTQLKQQNFFSEPGKKWISDIRFWIILFFVLRLYGITNAPLEIAHNWRQSLTNMIARNFLQIDSNILYPRIDVYGNRPGIMATEFPFFNYLIFLAARIFGYAHWYGRLINLLVSSAGVFYFYKLIKRFFTATMAFNASLILLCSLWFSFSRKAMPDTFCISLVLIGMYYGLLYLYEKRFVQLLLFFIFSTLGVLCKIPAIYLLIVFVLPMLDRRVEWKERILLMTAGAVLLALTVCWYFYWDPYLLETYGVQLYFPRSIGDGFRELVDYGGSTLEKFYFGALQSYAAFVLFIAGLLFMVSRREKLLARVFVLCTVLFFLFICKTGFVFSTHSYYIIPYVPVMAMVAAYALEQLAQRRIAVIFLALLSLEAILNQQNDFRIPDDERYKLGMEAMADRLIGKHELVVINGTQNPQQIYLLNRRGWSVDSEKLNDRRFLDSLETEGCRYMIVNQHMEGWSSIDKVQGKEVFRDKDFVVYSLLH
jgi:4-amino-4-deoxy-L-arabinose transferase-like glycosyltransferase